MYSETDIRTVGQKLYAIRDEHIIMLVFFLSSNA